MVVKSLDSNKRSNRPDDVVLTLEEVLSLDLKVVLDGWVVGSCDDRSILSLVSHYSELRICLCVAARSSTHAYDPTIQRQYISR